MVLQAKSLSLDKLVTNISLRQPQVSNDGKWKDLVMEGESAAKNMLAGRRLLCYRMQAESLSLPLHRSHRSKKETRLPQEMFS